MGTGATRSRPGKNARPYISLHGPPYVVDNLAYLPYGSAGMIILDVKNVLNLQK